MIIMSQATTPYSIYLLRLWHSGSQKTSWVFSLEDPRTGARRGFASLEELVIFLQQEVAVSDLPISGDPP